MDTFTRSAEPKVVSRSWSSSLAIPKSLTKFVAERCAAIAGKPFRTTVDYALSTHPDNREALDQTFQVDMLQRHMPWMKVDVFVVGRWLGVDIILTGTMQATTEFKRYFPPKDKFVEYEEKDYEWLQAAGLGETKKTVEPFFLVVDLKLQRELWHDFIFKYPLLSAPFDRPIDKIEFPDGTKVGFKHNTV